MLKVLLIFIFLLFSSQINASIAPHKIHQFTQPGELGNVVVYDITEDKQGFIWLGTNVGIVRYDGNEFIYYDSHNIKGGIVRSISVDQDNGIWAGSDLGLSYKAAAKESFESRAFHSIQSGSSLEIRRTLVHNNNVLVATSDGVFQTDLRLQSSAFLGLANCTVEVLTQTALGIAAGTSCGMYIYNNGQFLPIHLPTTNGEPPLVRNILPSALGILVGTYGAGVYVLNAQGEIQQHLTAKQQLNENRIYGLAVDNLDRLWVGFDSMGVQVFDADFNEVGRLNKNNHRPSLSDDAIENIFKSSNGDIWIGTTYGGLNQYKSGIEDITVLSSHAGADIQIQGDTVRGLYVDPQGNLWIGMHGNQFSVLDLNTAQFKSIQGALLGNHPVKFLYQNGFYWVFDEVGITQLTQDLAVVATYSKKNNTLPSAVLNAASFIDDHTLAIGHWGQGVTLFDLRSGKYTRYSSENSELENDYVLGLVKNKEHIWVSTKSGLSKISLVDGQIKNLQLSHLGPSVYINHLIKHKQHLLLATSAGITAYSLQNEVFDDSIIPQELKNIGDTRSLLINEFGYWVGSTQGVFHFNQGQLTRLNLSSGIADLDFVESSIADLGNGQVVFGAVGGASIIDAKKLPQVHKNHSITELTVYHTDGTSTLKRSVGKAVDLTQPTSLLQIKLSDLSYRDAHSRYSIEYNHSRYHYANNVISVALEYGNQVLSVMQGNKVVTQYKFNNPQPWFITPPALIFYALFAVLAVYAASQFRTKKLQLRALKLENKIAERTAELAVKKEQALQQAADIKKLADERQALFENISHELRTPLTLILGPMRQLHNSELLPAQLKHKANLVKKNAEKLNRLVNQILDLSRLNTIQQANTFCHFSELISDIINHYSGYLKERGISLGLDVERNLWVKLNNRDAELIFSNLFSNAIKYNKYNGQINIKLDAHQAKLRLTIEDSGIGIGPEYQDKVFERFFRVNAEHVSDIEGSGIGLSLVKQIVNDAGGHIVLRSVLHQGTKITITLPQYINNELVSPLGKKAQAAPLKDTSESIEKLILLVDDNQDILAYLSSIFEADYKVMTASNGRYGVEQALSLIPDLIITDVMMPEMDGMAFVERIKNNELTNHIPVIMLTAKGSPEAKNQGLRLKADDYIAKPFDQDELTLKVRNMLEAQALLRAKIETNLLVKNSKAPSSKPFFTKLNQVIARLYQDADMSVVELASEMALSERQLLRKVKAETGVGVKEYVREYRLDKAAELLTSGSSPSVVANEVGFSSLAYFSSCFKKQYGCSPSQY